MDAENLTKFPCMLLATCLDEDHMAASMIARVTYDIVGHELVVAEEQSWRVSVEPWTSPLGEFSPDQPRRKGGVDLFVAGSARAPGGEPVKELPLSLSVGDFRAEAIAIGPRVWQKRLGGGLVPSAPQPFTSLPIGLDRAFGGSVLWDGLRSPYPMNPDGVGFHGNDAVAAEGQPLPFIEDPRNRVRSLDDTPQPVGFGLCAFPHPLRLLDVVRLDGKAPLDYAKKFERGVSPQMSLSPRLFNRAFPNLVVAAVAPGSRVIAEGFSAAGPIAFTLPAPPASARLHLGDRRFDRPLEIDEIGIDADKRQAFIGFRFPFRYKFVAHEERRCELRPAGGQLGAPLAQALL